jgi:molybdenum cofactor cytidylyltransferase
MILPPTQRAAGLVLAAGTSSRMGSNKLLLEVAGEPLLRRAVRAALDAGLDPVIVVLAPDAEPARRVLAGLPCAYTTNPEPGRGQGSSLAAGVAALPEGAAAAVVVLPDMPRVSAAMIATLVDRWRATGAPIVVSRYGPTVAPPVLYARALFEALRAATGENPGKAVLAQQRGQAVELGWPVQLLADVDTPADLAAVQHAGAGGTP